MSLHGLLSFQVHCLTLVLSILKHEKTRRLWIACKRYPLKIFLFFTIEKIWKDVENCHKHMAKERLTLLRARGSQTLRLCSPMLYQLSKRYYCGASPKTRFICDNCPVYRQNSCFSHSIIKYDYCKTLSGIPSSFSGYRKESNNIRM